MIVSPAGADAGLLGKQGTSFSFSPWPRPCPRPRPRRPRRRSQLRPRASSASACPWRRGRSRRWCRACRRRRRRWCPVARWCGRPDPSRRRGCRRRLPSRLARKAARYVRLGAVERRKLCHVWAGRCGRRPVVGETVVAIKGSVGTRDDGCARAARRQREGCLVVDLERDAVRIWVTGADVRDEQDGLALRTDQHELEIVHELVADPCEPHVDVGDLTLEARNLDWGRIEAARTRRCPRCRQRDRSSVAERRRILGCGDSRNPLDPRPRRPRGCRPRPW